jgi:hypothetical protein
MGPNELRVIVKHMTEDCAAMLIRSGPGEYVDRISTITCSECGCDKPTSSFSQDMIDANGESYCKVCEIKIKSWKSENPDKIQYDNFGNPISGNLQNIDTNKKSGNRITAVCSKCGLTKNVLMFILDARYNKRRSSCRACEANRLARIRMEKKQLALGGDETCRNKEKSRANSVGIVTTVD